MSVSVLILTLNEELNLPGCLESVAWSDDIVVFDSFSSDRTVEIAKAAGTRVVNHKFDNYAAQRNAALTEVMYKYPWVLMVDADERITPETRVEIEQITSKETNTTLWRIRRKDMFQGQWLKRSNGYPTWFGRLFRLGGVWVEREINEEYHTDGQVGYLKTHLIHYPFNKGINFWIERHNRYSSMEAAALVRETKTKLDLRDLFSADPTMRRKSLKQLAYRLPFRPFIVFCYWYLFRFGFIDGIPGLTYCRLRAIYEYMIDLKVKELRRRKRDLPV
jgi:glycosyltransferase involved in cell wall biosynthesis